MIQSPHSPQRQNHTAIPVARVFFNSLLGLLALSERRDSSSETGARIMRYEVNDYEWTAIKPMVPNKPCGVFGM